VPLTLELKLDPVVNESLARETLADADLLQEVDRSLLEYARSNPVFHVPAAPPLEDDGVDSLQVQEMCQHQAGGAPADNYDLRALAQPQTSAAVSTIRRSFPTCCA
jgi:hypothetical protein